MLYRNNLKNRDFDKKGSQNLHSERGTIAERQGQSENANSEINPTQSKTDSSSCFGITMSLDLMRRTASRLLAAAALELFPNTVLVGGGETPLGFYYEFVFPFVFTKEFFPLLVEKMRQIRSEARAITILDMMPQNAGEFLTHHGHPMRATRVRESSSSLTQLCRMGSFIDWCEGGTAESSQGVGEFALQEFSLSGQVVRIIGSAFETKEELKLFLKKVDHLSSFDHLLLGKELKLFAPCEKGWIWYPKGELLRRLIYAFWEKEHLEQGFQLLGACSIDEAKAQTAYHRDTGERRIAQWCHKTGGGQTEALTGLFENSSMGSRDLSSLFCTPSELPSAIISSLQLFVKLSKLLDFRFELSQFPSWQKKEDALLFQIAKEGGFDLSLDRKRQKCDSPTVEMHVEDALGRRWPLASLEVRFKENLVVRSLFTSVERFIALLLERHKGVFPFWLAPEQVKVFAVSEGVNERVEEVQKILTMQGFRVTIDCRIEKLSRRMHNALQEKLPFCIFVGKREWKENRLTVRDNRKEQEESMDMEQLVEHLHAENRK